MAISRQVRRSLALALLGLAAGLGLVAVLFGGWQTVLRTSGWTGSEPAATAPQPDGGARALAGAGRVPGAPTAEGMAAGMAQERAKGTAQGVDNGPGGGPVPGRKPADAAAGPEAPSFDIVRVEPNGDAVVAGRGAPNTVVEMLLDGKPVAKALTDPNGQFAIVPPALPTGSSEIQLRAKAADGRETRSTQSVAVAVSARRDQKPLVALTAPDRPTVVLSQPGAPEPAKVAERRVAEPAAKPRPQAGRTPSPGSEAAATKPAPARVVSVDAQEGGRLFVTGAGTPGASVRLYLNDTLIAPGSVGPDGTVTFTIGRGVKPGQYQVRIDQIEPGSDKVRSRAEVPFAVPEPTRLAGREPPGAGRPGETGAAVGMGGGSGGKPGTPAARSERAPAAEGRAAQSGTAPAAPGPVPPMAGERPMAAGPSAATPGSAAGRTPPPTAGGVGDPARATSDAPAPGAGPARAGAVFVPEISTARISRGDNLWRISTRAYGRGERYTVIFDANQDQIRDPDLIYPGQIFVLPTDKRG